MNSLGMIKASNWGNNPLMYILFVLQWTHKFKSALVATEICNLKGHMMYVKYPFT